MDIKQNPVLYKQINDFVNSSDFLTAKIPEYLQQYINYTLCVDVFQILLACLFFFLAHRSFFRWSNQKSTSSGSFWSDTKFASFLIGVIGGTFALASLIIAILQIFQIFFAPKFFIMALVHQ